MHKATAYELLSHAWGIQQSDIASMARCLRITPQALYKWPEVLPEQSAARVALSVARGRARQLKAMGVRLHPLEEDAVV
jgi:hypothetical protein